MLLVIASGIRCTAWGLEAGVTPKSGSTVCSQINNLGRDTDNDIAVLQQYKFVMQRLLVNEKFDDLDCIADSARSQKTKFPGGMWKLHILYQGLSKPQGHATEEDWRSHLERLNRWVSAKPDSITARVALAESYVSYAWEARGDGYSDSVSESGWRLFGERVDKAKEILEQASSLHTKCPEWYLTMQQIAQAQQWEIPKLTALLEQAISFEPAYYYYYRVHANLLQPKWFGEEGDAEKFAQQAADRVGGTQGDILYFQIASHLICKCDAEPQLKEMSWPRIQKGFAELEKQSGRSATNMNLLAYMAIKESDAAVANESFAGIGDKWDREIWDSQSYFDSCKEWASNTVKAAAFTKSMREAIDAADANMRTPSGRKYEKAFRKKFASMIQECVNGAGSDLGRFELLFRIGKDGIIDRLAADPTTQVGTCMFKITQQKMAAPPSSPYWLRIEIDPAALASVAAK